MKKFLDNFVCISQNSLLSVYNEIKTDKLIISSNWSPGFYERLPIEKNTPSEHHLFLVAKKIPVCFQDAVFRTVSKYEIKNNVNIHIYPGRIELHKNFYGAIRFRENEISNIMKLIPEFENKGIEFLKAKGNNFGKYETVVQFKKHITADYLFENIYRDKHAKHVYYINIPADIKFDYFRKIVEYIRNSCSFKNFDASLVYSLNSFYQTEDYAMIYSPNCEEDRLVEFAEKLKKALKII